MTLLSILLQGAPAGGSFLSGTLPMILMMVVVFYFFMILPQQRKVKKQKAFMNDLKKGDRVITTGGIHGKIISVEEKTLIIESEGTRLKLEKAGISMDMSMPLNQPAKGEENKTEAKA